MQPLFNTVDIITIDEQIATWLIDRDGRQEGVIRQTPSLDAIVWTTIADEDYTIICDDETEGEGQICSDDGRNFCTCVEPDDQFTVVNVGRDKCVISVDEHCVRICTDGCSVGKSGGIGIPRCIRTKCRLIERCR